MSTGALMQKEFDAQSGCNVKLRISFNEVEQGREMQKMTCSGFRVAPQASLALAI